MESSNGADVVVEDAEDETRDGAWSGPRQARAGFASCNCLIDKKLRELVILAGHKPSILL